MAMVDRIGVQVNSNRVYMDAAFQPRSAFRFYCAVGSATLRLGPGEVPT